MTLNGEHCQLLRRALKGQYGREEVTAQQRRAIRHICADVAPGTEPEKVLIAFKAALADAANAEHIALGRERNAMISGLVSLFIEELYAAGVAERVCYIRNDTDGRASPSRISTENGSSDARL